MKYTPNTLEVNILKPRDAVGHIVGNFLILSRAGNGRVKAKCLLCGNENFETQWYKIKSGHTTSDGCKHKMMNPEQYIGKVYGKLTVLKIVPEKDNGAVQARFQCECGAKTVKVLNAVQRSKILSCGCGGRTRGGLSSGENARLYSIWRQMMCRCYQKGGVVTDNTELNFLNNPKTHARYKDYGLRGITVHKDWHKLDYFINWYKQNIPVGMSMDRIDNDKGYSSDNVRSASNMLQSRNQRVRRDSKTGYKGVRPIGNGYRWAIKHMYKEYGKEGLATAEQALLERNLYIVEHHLPHDIQVPNYAHTLDIASIGVGNSYSLAIKDTHKKQIYMGARSWKTKDDPLLIKLVNAMKKAYVDSCGLD